MSVSMLEPLTQAVLELDKALEGLVPLCIGGGYGLFLKQNHLAIDRGTRTLFPSEALPGARTTADIDLFLRADVVADPEQMKRIRKSLDQMGFVVVEGVEFMQFTRQAERGTVKVDLLVGPVDRVKKRLHRKGARVRPREKVELHAYLTPEAIAIDEATIRISLKGLLPDGRQHETVVLIPQAFTYLLMKIRAFNDRAGDSDKNLGRHHALDAYRIVGLLTESEDERVRALSLEYREHPEVVETRRIVQANFANDTSLGLLRIREHPLFHDKMRLREFCDELSRIFPPNR